MKMEGRGIEEGVLCRDIEELKEIIEYVGSAKGGYDCILFIGCYNH